MTTPYLHIVPRTEAEVRQAVYDRDVLASIAAIARVPAPMGSHELQLIREHKLQQRLSAAVDEMRAAISDVNRMSAFVHIDAETFDNIVHDEFPSKDHWDNQIASAPGGIL